MEVGSWIYQNDSKEIVFFPSQYELTEFNEIQTTPTPKIKDKLFGYDIKSVTLENINENTINPEDINIKLVNETSDMYITPNIFLQVLYYFWGLFMKFRMNQKHTEWKEGGIVLENYHQLYLIKNKNKLYQNDVWEYIDLTTGLSGYYKSLESRIYIHPYIAWIYLMLRFFMALIFRQKGLIFYSKMPYVIPSFMSISLINFQLWNNTLDKYNNYGTEDAISYLIEFMKNDPNFNKTINEVKFSLNKDSKMTNKNKIMNMLFDPIESISNNFKQLSKNDPDSTIAMADKMGLLNKSILADIIEVNLDYFLFSGKKQKY